MDDKDVTILAEYKRMAYGFEGDLITQWGIKRVDKESERDEFVTKYGARELWGFAIPYVTLRRTVRVENSQENYTEWDILDFADGIDQAVQSFGDGAYYTATSIHPMHVQEVIRHARWMEDSKELKSLQDRINPRWYNGNSDLTLEYESEYEQELKDRKLYRKAQRGTADPKIIEEIKQKIAAEYRAKLLEITKRIVELEERLK